MPLTHGVLRSGGSGPRTCPSRGGASSCPGAWMPPASCAYGQLGSGRAQPPRHSPARGGQGPAGVLL